MIPSSYMKSYLAATVTIIMKYIKEILNSTIKVIYRHPTIFRHYKTCFVQSNSSLLLLIINVFRIVINSNLCISSLLYPKIKKNSVI